MWELNSDHQGWQRAAALPTEPDGWPDILILIIIIITSVALAGLVLAG